MTEITKIPPQAIDLEEAVLGAVLIESWSFGEIAHILTENSFYKPEHQEIFNACQDLNAKAKPIDILTVTDHLKLVDKLEFTGGIPYLMKLTSRIAGASNIQHHAYILKEKEILRNIITLTSETNGKCYDPTTDAFDLLNEIDTHLQELNNVGTLKEPQTTKAVFKESLQHYEKPTVSSPLMIGAPNFDDHFNFEGGDYIVLAARPGMGKTAFMLEMAKQSASNGFPGAIFSLEMSAKQLMDRLIANFEQIPLSGIKNKNLEPHLFEKYATSKVVDLPIFIDDTASSTINQIRAKATKLKKQKGIEWVVIDYLQLITASSKNKNYNKTQEIGDISRQIKILAKELDIPVVVLSQLNRAVETRGGLKKPQNSDLRESGDIEQDADVIFFLWRPEYYEFEQDEEGRFYEAGETHVLNTKYRNGDPRMTSLIFDKNHQTFKRMENEY